MQKTSPTSQSPAQIRFQVLSFADAVEIQVFAEAQHARRVPDEIERRFASWQASWRPESLEHYLKLGWSFIARRATISPDGTSRTETCGFFLAQPFLFVRGQAQTLWLEHLEADDEQVANELTEIAVKVAREKHLQRVLVNGSVGEVFGGSEKLASQLARFGPRAPFAMNETIFEVRTTKG